MYRSPIALKRAIHRTALGERLRFSINTAVLFNDVAKLGVVLSPGVKD